MEADLEFVETVKELERELAKAILAEIKEMDLKGGGFRPAINCNDLKCVKEFDMARKPRKSKIANAESNVGKLISALKFLMLVQGKSSHCQIKDHWAMAKVDGMLLGAKVDEDISACPKTYQLLNILGAANSEVKITQLNALELNVKVSNISANIACIESLPEGELNASMADPIAAPIGNVVLDALKALKPLVSKSAENYVLGCVFLQANSAVATDGSAMLEYWHGVNLPPNMLIPREAVDVLIAAGKDLTGIGYSGPTVTFYFEDESFVQIDLIQEPYIAYEQMLNMPTNQAALPEGFYEALDVLKSASQTKTVEFTEESMVSDGISVDIVGLPNHIAFDMAYLQMFKDYIKTVDFNVSEQHCLWYGDNIRGIVKAVE